MKISAATKNETYEVIVKFYSEKTQENYERKVIINKVLKNTIVSSNESPSNSTSKDVNSSSEDSANSNETLSSKSGN